MGGKAKSNGKLHNRYLGLGAKKAMTYVRRLYRSLILHFKACNEFGGFY